MLRLVKDLGIKKKGLVDDEEFRAIVASVTGSRWVTAA